MNLNKVILIGRTCGVPELKTLPSGVKVVSFSLATNRVWKDKDGAKQEDTTFHNIIGFGKTAEVIAEYVEKGQELMIEGRIQNRSWEDKNSGEKKYRSEVMLENFQFGARSGSGGGERSERSSAPAKKTSSYAGKNRQSKKDLDEAFPDDDVVEEGDVNPKDIPF